MNGTRHTKGERLGQSGIRARLAKLWVLSPADAEKRNQKNQNVRHRKKPVDCAKKILTDIEYEWYSFL
jgi:hypothetical protein